MKGILLLVICFSLSSSMYSQATREADSALLILLNQTIDDCVGKRDLSAPDTLYAPDFVFSHGSGRVEGKSGWLTTVARADYSLRRHDSVTAELHPGITVLKRKMRIKKVNKNNTDTYTLRYIRIYAIRDRQWQLVSHTTTYERHE